MDDEEEIARLLDGLELPDVEDDAQNDAVPPRLSDLDDWGFQ